MMHIGIETICGNFHYHLGIRNCQDWSVMQKVL